MKSILYISLVDWNWIKQRPQILAEELSNYYNVHFLCPRYYHKARLTNNENKHKNLQIEWRIKIPFSGRSQLLKRLDNIVGHMSMLRSIKKNNPDIIYVSHPNDYSLGILRCKQYIIYDCMDNYSEFCGDQDRIRIIEAEKKLCERADCILVSSEYLMHKIISYNVSASKIHLIRNGYAGSILSGDLLSLLPQKSNKYKVIYFGTISAWFDFDLLTQFLDENQNYEFHIAGPLDTVFPKVNGLSYDGIIQHDKLYDYVRDCDVLLMPFKVNSIVEAVDPVKIYEYINFNKAIVTVEYDEIKRFSDFVFFYHDYSSFRDAMFLAVSEGKKYSLNERNLFLMDNNWKNRGEELISIIESEV